MEASAVREASSRGLLARSSPLLRLASDERLVELIRAHHERAFEVLFERYQPRLLAFCRNMLPSQQDAEDILQEVFIAAHQAMIGDTRALKVKPWLYRIARNRCLNHLRRQTADGQDSMDEFVHAHGATTAQQVENREEFRQLLHDVRDLPETQRTALLLREIDALSYDEIAHSMGTTVPAVKSLLVRARVTLAESSQARQLTCGEVRLQLAEAAEGLRKVDGPVRQHVRRCEDCHDFRNQLHADAKALQAIFPLGPLALLKGFLIAKIGFGGSGAAAGGGAACAGAGAASGGVAMAGGAAGGGAFSTAVGGLAAGGGLGGAVGGAIGAKAAAGVATAALLTAGAVEVKSLTQKDPQRTPAAAEERVVANQDSTKSVRSSRKPAQASTSGTAAKKPAKEKAAPAREKPPEETATVATLKPEVTVNGTTGATAAPAPGKLIEGETTTETVSGTGTKSTTTSETSGETSGSGSKTTPESGSTTATGSSTSDSESGTTAKGSSTQEPSTSDSDSDGTNASSSGG